jgi:hypothetical protein
VLIICLVVWVSRKYKKTKSNHGKIEFSPKGTKDVSAPFKDMMETNRYEFSNPTFISTPAAPKENVISNRETPKLQLSNLTDDETTASPSAAVGIKTPSSATKMFDNPLYESADQVIRKQQEENCLNPLYKSVDHVTQNHMCDKLVLNPIYMSCDPSEVENKRIWREDRFSQC